MRWLKAAGRLVAVCAAVKLALHLYAGRAYGYFVDELYYLACAEHLAWGYVDQPPLVALLARIVRTVLGDSLSAIRLLPAIAGAGKVLLAGLLARELGGGPAAQGLAALCVLAAPGFLATDHFLSMNAFEPLFWLGCAYIVLRIVKSSATGDATNLPRLWLAFGLLAGLGLENKHSMLIFGFALVVGLLLTPQRAVLWSPWSLAGGALALLLFLPNLVWNIQQHFPFLEIQANIRASGRNAALSPLSFFKEEILAMQPLALPVWLAGLWFFFADSTGKAHRWLGWTWVVAAAVIVAANPRIYYLFPAYPLLFAGGAVLLERWLPSRAFPVYAAAIAITGALLAPIALPLLPVPSFLAYSAALHLNQPSIENHEMGPLPQLFADQFGWEQMAATVAKAFQALPPQVRARTAIFGQNYGQAGAIDLFGPKYGLPKAISGHQNYFLWGPRDYDGDNMLVLDGREEVLHTLFEHVEKAGTVYHPYSMPYQHFDIYYCSGAKTPLRQLWPGLKRWG